MASQEANVTGELRVETPRKHRRGEAGELTTRHWGPGTKPRPAGSPIRGHQVDLQGWEELSKPSQSWLFRNLPNMSSEKGTGLTPSYKFTHLRPLFPQLRTGPPRRESGNSAIKASFIRTSVCGPCGRLGVPETQEKTVSL